MMETLFKRFVRIFWLLPGFLLWASFPPMGETADCLFALAPLLWLSRNADTRLAVRRWFLNGLLFWVATLSWMPAIVKNGGPWPLVVLGWGALAAYCAAYFAAFGYLSSKAWAFVRGRAYWWRLLAILVVEPVLWGGLELVRSRLAGGFAWNQLGVIPANSLFGAPAAIGGVYLLSMVVVAINGTVASIAERMLEPLVSRRRRRLEFPAGAVDVPAGGDGARQGPPRWARSVETLLPFAAVFCLYEMSGGVVARRGGGDAGASLSVAMVQRNFPCVFKSADENPYKVYDSLLANVTPLKPDLVVLPESAMCEFGPLGQQGAERFADWVRERTGAALLAGGTRFGDGAEYNSAALYRRDGAVMTYDKVHLVPFGEFIPGDKVFPALQKLAPVGSCTPGELRLVPLEPGEDGRYLGVAICFEDTDSAQMRRLARMGASALVFITNDSWFSHSVEAEQHAWQAVARAIETGLAVVRVGNNGVTGTISPEGRKFWLSGEDGRPLVDRSGTMLDKVWLAPPHGGDGGLRGCTTPYCAFGDVPLASAFAALLAIFAFVRLRGARGRMWRRIVRSARARSGDMV